MVQAACKAGRSLSRDFGEVQNLQVSLKGPGDFVSQADRKAEEIVFAELSRARPGYGFLMEEGGAVEGDDASTAGSSTRSTAPPTSCTASRSSPSRSRWSARARSSPASSTIRRWTSSTRPSAAAAPSSTTGACASPARTKLDRRRHRHRHAASRPRPPRQLPRPAAQRHGRSLRHPPLRRRRRSISPMSRPAASTASGKTGLSAWDIAAGLMLIREAGGFAPTRPAARTC